MGINQTDGADNMVLSPLEIDAIGEVMNISMGAAATAISQMLNKQVEITTPTVGIMAMGDVKVDQFEPALLVKIVYTSGLSGSNVMVFRQHDMQMILNTLMGIPDPPSDDFVFDELSISAACEVMNQMMGSSATALAEFLSKTVDISTPIAKVMDETNTFADMMEMGLDEEVVTITFRLKIKDMLESDFVSVMTIDLVKDIISQFINNDGDVQMQSAPAAPAATQAPQPPAMPPAAAQQQPQQMPQGAPPMMGTDPAAMQQQAYGAQGYPPQPYPGGGYAPPAGYMPPMGYPQAYSQPQQYMPPVNPVNAQQVEFPEFSSGSFGAGPPVMGSNLDLIMNVPLEVSIEIGTTKKKIKDIVGFTAGTVVELDKQAGAPVDIVVNGQLIAHGDVVVIDDNFGVRITEIVGTKELLNSLAPGAKEN